METTATKRRWSPGTIAFSMSYEAAIDRLKSIARRLGINPEPGANQLDYKLTMGANAEALVKIFYRGVWHEFHYSRQKAEFFHKKIPADKDVFVAVVVCLQDLTRVAERGVFDFGVLVQGFKSLTFQKLPEFATFFGFTIMPTWDDVRKRFAELVKPGGAFNAERYPADSMIAKQYYDQAKVYFKVK